jgi:hypothetical protein
MMTTITLPPPPLPNELGRDSNAFRSWPVYGYTADQLRADRIAVAAAVLDACARDIEGYTEAGWAGLSAYQIADTIRSLKIEKLK